MLSLGVFAVRVLSCEGMLGWLDSVGWPGQPGRASSCYSSPEFLGCEL